MHDCHGWNAEGKPEMYRTVICEVKSGFKHFCTYMGGHVYNINGRFDGTLNERKVVRWKYL